jgi:L-alanine-DL-glutamate epimerase-like enolase superfamily enzyme
MKITQVDVFAKRLPMASGYNMSSSAVGDPDTTVVSLLTDSGLVGWGEICPTGPLPQVEHAGSIRADLDLLGPALIGADPRRIGLIHDALAATMDGGQGARSAIDIACWDLLGKFHNERVCDLLGGVRMDPVLTYHVVPIGTPQASAQLAEELQEEGHTKLQLKSGGRHVDEDIAAIHAVSRVIRSGVDLFVDCNRGWTVSEAIQVSGACRDLKLAIEQPCATYAECAAARPHLHHPLILDESATDLATIARAIATGVADGFGMKLTRIGGISGMRAVRDLCETFKTPTSCDDSWGGDIIAAACVHVGSTLQPHLSRGAWISDPYQAGHYDEAHGPRIVNGRIAVPPGPGLGITIPQDCFGSPIASFS